MSDFFGDEHQAFLVNADLDQDQLDDDEKVSTEELMMRGVTNLYHRCLGLLQRRVTVADYDRVDGPFLRYSGKTVPTLNLHGLSRFGKFVVGMREMDSGGAFVVDRNDIQVSGSDAIRSQFNETSDVKEVYQVQFFSDDGEIHDVTGEELVDAMCDGFDEMNTRFVSLFKRLEETQNIALEASR